MPGSSTAFPGWCKIAVADEHRFRGRSVSLHIQILSSNLSVICVPSETG
jgi:hypothetical protein